MIRFFWQHNDWVCTDNILTHGQGRKIQHNGIKIKVVAALDAESLESKSDTGRAWGMVMYVRLPTKTSLGPKDRHKPTRYKLYTWYCRELYCHKMLKASHVISWKYHSMHLYALTVTVGNSSVGAPPQLLHLSLAQNHAEAGGWPVKVEDTNDNADHNHNHNCHLVFRWLKTSSCLNIFLEPPQKKARF